MRDNILKRTIIRLFFPFGSVRRILLGPCRGMSVEITPDSGHSIFFGYERSHQSFLAGKIRPGMVVYDVGAHIGQYALFFAKRVGPGGRVLSFEPNPDIFEQLKRNVALNGLENVTCINSALGENNGAAKFQLNAVSQSMGKVAGVESTYIIENSREISVPMIKMDDLLAKFPPPNVIKVDTEGSLAIILKGAGRIIREFRPSFYMELHGPDEQKAAAALIEEGYRLEDIAGGRADDIASRWHSPLWAHPA